MGQKLELSLTPGAKGHGQKLELSLTLNLTGAEILGTKEVR